MSEITEKSISAFFAGAYLERGREYKKNVVEVEVIPGKNNRYKIRSMVQGTRSRPYKNSITLVQGKNNAVIYGECNCPVSYNCKHVAATLLVAIDRKLFKPVDPKIERREKYNLWLSQLLKENNPFEEDTQEAASSQIFYTLKETEKKAQYEVSVKSRRYLKKGGFGKESSFKLDKYKNDYDFPEFANEEDAKILTLLLQLQDNTNYSSTVVLEGLLGNILLEMLIKTERFYYQGKRTSHINMGENVDFILDWLESENSELELRFIAENEENSLIFLDTPMYINAKDSVIGKAKGLDYSNEMMQTLLHAPTLHVDDSEYLSEKLIEHVPEANVPIPSAKYVDTLEDVKPSFHLLLQKEVFDDKTRYQAIFKILYAGNSINLRKESAREVVRNTNNTLIEILRDIEREKSALKRLESLGLHEGKRSIPSEMILYFDTFSSTQESLASWHTFLDTGVKELEMEGWNVELDSGFSMSFDVADSINANIEEQNSWFNLSFDLHVNGQKHNTIKIVSELLKSYESIVDMPETIYLPLGDEKYVSIPKKAIEPMVEILFELYGSKNLETFRLNSFDAPILAKLENSALSFSGSDKLQKIAEALASFDGIKEATVPSGLVATMRDYQVEGFSWLQFLREYNFGGILADDMGLGKTIQTLAHILKEKEEGRASHPFLIIAPTSLMSNWKSETKKFAPNLSVLILQGSDRQKHFDEISNYDIVLTTYPLIVRDFEVLERMTFYYLILDEAQYIKNYRSKAAQHIRALRAKHRLCLTGTPMENHLGELWGLFDFLMPGFLFENKFFTDNFRTPIEQEQNSAKSKLLNERVKPFLLRRTKTEVATELPSKTEIIQKVPLGAKQSELYESIRIAMDKQVREAISEKGLGRSQIMILDALLKLRQVCCDPRLVKLDRAREVKESAKFEMLFDLLHDLIRDGRKILLFSQFTSMLALIEDELKVQNIKYSKLTGQTKKREEAIDYFKSDEVSLFLISLKSGGVGLNLTEADTVIHYDPWWNPAAENQATDRAYRIGQDKPVFVYKLITENTLEEKIVNLQQKKQAIADNVYENKNEASGVSQEDLNDLFMPISGS